MPRTWEEPEIKELILSNDEMVKRSLLKLYEMQTEDEQVSRETKHHNGIGFSAFDSKILTGIAKYLKDKEKLSVNQIILVRKKLVKYTKQITKIANNNPGR